MVLGTSDVFGMFANHIYNVGAPLIRGKVAHARVPELCSSLGPIRDMYAVMISFRRTRTLAYCYANLEDVMVAPQSVGRIFPCRQERAVDPRKIWGRIRFLGGSLAGGVCGVVQEGEVVVARERM